MESTADARCRKTKMEEEKNVLKNQQHRGEHANGHGSRWAGCRQTQRGRDSVPAKIRRPYGSSDI